MVFSRKRKGQSIIEYVILMAVVIAALILMQTFIKRGYSGHLKESSDQMGEGFSATGTTTRVSRILSGQETITSGSGNISSLSGSISIGAPEGALTYSERSGGTRTTTSNARMDGAAAEGYEAGDLPTDVVADF